MRRSGALVAAFLCAIAAGTAPAEEDVKTHMDAARAASGDFGKALLGELQTAIAAGGPVNAIGVCNAVAPQIAAEKSAQAHMSIGRTSLKLRQPKNQPDDWELKQLRSFEQRKAAGENPAMIEVGEWTERDGKRVFRYMKAIPTGEICLNCHGANLASEVVSALTTLYPQDQATGFKLGDLRGAFTVTQVP